MVSLSATSPVNNKPKPNGFDSAVNMVKFGGQKDFLRTMRFTLEWGKAVSKNLKNVKPITIFIKGVKHTEDFLAFGEFFTASCKAASSVKNALKHGFTKTYSSLKASALELIWNIFKVVKCLKAYGIYALKATLFTPLMAIGGVSFAVNSFDKAKKEILAGKKIFNAKPKSSENSLLNKIDIFNYFTPSVKDKKKELAIRTATIEYHGLKALRNGGTTIVGAIVTLNALFAFAVSGFTMLTLGTVILVSNTAASIIKESNHLKV